VTAGRTDFAAGAGESSAATSATGAFVFEAEQGVLRAANADGSGSRCLVRGRSPLWSPDGSKILFYEEGPTFWTGRLATLRVADGSVREVARNASSNASWSPDGRRFVYTRVRVARGGTELVIANADGGQRRVLARYAPHRHQPDNAAWSPRGKEIAFLDFDRANKPLIWSLFVIRPDGHGRRRILRNVDGPYAPVWSPDGRMIAFLRGHSGEGGPFIDRVWVAHADGTHAHPITPLLNYVSTPAWSSDGRFLAVGADPTRTDTQPTLYLLQPSRLATTILAVGGEGAFNWVAWAPDAPVLATETSSGSIALVDATGGPERIVVTSGDHAAWDPRRRDTTAYHAASQAPSPCQ
jgi:Tol biopolymer transport system component